MKKRNLIFSLLALVSVLGSCGKGNIDTSLPTVNPSTQQPTDKKSTHHLRNLRRSSIRLLSI